MQEDQESQAVLAPDKPERKPRRVKPLVIRRRGDQMSVTIRLSPEMLAALANQGISRQVVRKGLRVIVPSMTSTANPGGALAWAVYRRGRLVGAGAVAAPVLPSRARRPKAP